MDSREEKEYYINLWRESFCTNKLGCGTPMFAVIVVGILIFLSSCAAKTHVEYVDREVVRYESKIQIDTLINNVHDSVYVERNGDTVFVNKWHTAIREKIKERTDTCWRDSVMIETKEKIVEKQIIPKWCYGSLVVCLLFIIFAIIKFGRKLW